MSAREEIEEVLKRTYATTGRAVTADELLRLYRQNPELVGRGTEAHRLLERFDQEERAERLNRAAQDEFGFSYADLLKLVQEQLSRERIGSHYFNAFVYGMHSNPFASYGRSHAQQFRTPPVSNPERLAIIAKAKKIKALADDRRGDANTRSIAARRFADMKAKHGLTEAELR